MSEVGAILAVRRTQHGSVPAPCQDHATAQGGDGGPGQLGSGASASHLANDQCTPPNLRHRFPWSQPPSPLFRSAKPTQECASHPRSEHPYDGAHRRSHSPRCLFWPAGFAGRSGDRSPLYGAFGAVFSGDLFSSPSALLWSCW
jgi:hypothetical protein